MILIKEAIESLNKNLSLPSTGMEQDWEIELADLNRIEEFVSFYKNSSLNEEEKKALMSLIVASYDDYLNEKHISNEVFEREIKKLLTIDKYLFTELFDYWSLIGESNPDNYFKITPLIRNIKASI
jgi:hypothetical protein